MVQKSESILKGQWKFFMQCAQFVIKGLALSCLMLLSSTLSCLIIKSFPMFSFYVFAFAYCIHLGNFFFSQTFVVFSIFWSLSSATICSIEVLPSFIIQSEINFLLIGKFSKFIFVSMTDMFDISIPVSVCFISYFHTF